MVYEVLFVFHFHFFLLFFSFLSFLPSRPIDIGQVVIDAVCNAPARISSREREIAFVAASPAFSDVYAELNGLAASRSCGRRMRLRKDQPPGRLMANVFRNQSREFSSPPVVTFSFFFSFFPHVPWKFTAEIMTR